GILAVLRKGGFRRGVSAVGGVGTALLLVTVGSLIYGAMTDCLPDQVRGFLETEHAARKREYPEREQRAQFVAGGFRDQGGQGEGAGRWPRAASRRRGRSCCCTATRTRRGPSCSSRRAASATASTTAGRAWTTSTRPRTTRSSGPATWPGSGRRSGSGGCSTTS